MEFIFHLVTPSVHLWTWLCDDNVHFHWLINFPKIQTLKSLAKSRQIKGFLMKQMPGVRWSVRSSLHFWLAHVLATEEHCVFLRPSRYCGTPRFFPHFCVCVCMWDLRTHEDFFSQLLSSLRNRYPKTITLDSEK